jgi:molybdopterin-guanine dinucleotide biosynthesis protein A/rhodanese-related sulfurtransferase
MTTAPAAAVLAGGASTRMGRDKSLVEVSGVPMAQRVAHALGARSGRPVYLVGGEAENAVRLGLEFIPDHRAGEGPLVGVWSVMDRLCCDVVVAACDLPLLDEATVAAFDTDMAGGADVAVALVGGRRQPSLARWNHRCLGRVAESVEAGERSLLRMLESLEVVEIPCEPGRMVNANRPEDLPRNVATNVRTIATMSAMTFTEATPAELSLALAQGARLIDVREQAEFEQAHVPGARLISLNTVPDNVDAFRGDGPTYVICHSGGRSSAACDYLASQGVTVINVAGGTMGWMASGFEIATGLE